MKYTLIGDSVVDTTKELQQYLQIKKAPLKLMIGEKSYIDDDDLDMEAFTHELRINEGVPKTAAPAPGDFIKHLKGNDDGAFIITISSRLSGTYNAATMAKDTYLEENHNYKIHIFDSLGATASETTLALKIKELIDENLSFEQIVEKGENFIKKLNTRFLLEDVSALEKNGRLSKLGALVVQFLHIKPILGDDGNGEIHLCDKARTTTKALDKLISQILTTPRNEDSNNLVITHSFALDKATYIKEKIEKENVFKNIYIVPTAGLASIYAGFGGVVCGF